MNGAPRSPLRYALTSRLLHWSMAAMVVPMFFIGVSMVTSLVDYHRLVSIHRPLGIAILVLVVVRYVNRRLTRLPDFLETMSSSERRVATWSERLLYALMFSMPLIGWGMLSAARDPIVLVGRAHLPPILPHGVRLYELLRTAHTVLAYLFFATFLAHLGGVLFHALVIRDGILRRMTWQAAPRRGNPVTDEPRDVDAQLTFLGEVSGVPTNYLDVEPPLGTPRLYPRVRRAVVVHDARAAGQLSVGREGVILAEHPAGVMSDFGDEEALRSAYYPAVERLVRDVTGATRVLVFDHTRRSSAIARRAASGTDIAVDEAHNDYTERSGPRRVRELLAALAPDEDPDALMLGRYAIFNVWRPTNGPVEQWPLAVCDMQSMARDDFVDTELRWPHRTGHVCAVRHNPSQRWLYFPWIDVGQALVFKCYDSVGDARGARFGAHTAFVDPRSPKDARTRESIEARTIALFAAC